MGRREIRSDLDAVGLHVGNRGADEPRHLARMRGDDQIAILAAGQAAGIVGQHGERVGVQDQRDGGSIEKRADELRDLRRAAKPRSAGHDVVCLFQQLLYPGSRRRSRGIIGKVDGHEHR